MHTRAKTKRGSTDEETAERLDIAALYLKNLTSVVSMLNTNLGGKIDNLGDKVDSIKEDTGEMTTGYIVFCIPQLFKYENYIYLVRTRVTCSSIFLAEEKSRGRRRTEKWKHEAEFLRSLL